MADFHVAFFFILHFENYNIFEMFKVPTIEVTINTNKTVMPFDYTYVKIDQL